MKPRHIYSREQLTQYFERISLPKSERIYNMKKAVHPEGKALDYLSLLVKHHLCTIPWENLTQHYSWHGVVNVKPQHLFAKIVQSGNRGGYCMEANYFFHLILCSLNFDVHMVGSRIHRGNDTYGGFTHVVNIVTIGGSSATAANNEKNQKRYLVDGGFGPQGPSSPLEIVEGVAVTQIWPAKMRLLYEPMAEQVDPHRDTRQKVWKYQYLKHQEEEEEGTSGWATMYCFVETEFTPADIEAMNFAPWLNRKSFFTHKVVAVRFTTERENGFDSNPLGLLPGLPMEEMFEDGAQINGTITLNHDHLTWKINGQTAVSVKFTTDQQRVAALAQYFGIVLSQQDEEAIVGTAAYLTEGPLTGVDG